MSFLSEFFNGLFSRHTCKRPFKSLKKGDKFHFIAIGGVGQSALAKILIKSGYKVTGSDISDSKYLKELKSLGAKVSIGHSADNVPSDCFIVLSSAIKEDNPELIRAKKLGLTVIHRSDLLSVLMKSYNLTAGFAGTHGKTTTSGFTAYLLQKMNKAPSFAIGGIIPELNTNADASKDSNIFVAELDESDGTIVKYSPNILVINNLEADHPDFYKNGLPDILNTFEKLIVSGRDDAKILVNIDDDGNLALLERLKSSSFYKNIIKFSAGCAKKSDIQTSNGHYPDIIAEDITFNETGAEFEVIYKNKPLGKIHTSLKGIHNVYNTLAVVGALIEAGYNFDDFEPFISGFTGMGRRFQTVFKNEKFEIIDDYAHHPAEIKATLKAALEYKIKTGSKKLVAIFQPHRYSRFKSLWEDFLNAFNDCDILIILDVYSAGDKFDLEFNSQNFAKLYKEKHPEKNIYYIGGKIPDIIFNVKEKIKENISGSKDIIITLGAGDITKLGVPLGNELSKDN